MTLSPISDFIIKILKGGLRVPCGRYWNLFACRPLVTADLLLRLSSSVWLLLTCCQ